MESDAWRTSGTTVRLTATGTLVGMPAVAKGFDALHPERWSMPPASGTAPIVPYEGPEDEGDTELESPWRMLRARAPTFAREPASILPVRRVMPADERRLLTRAALVASVVVAIVTAWIALAA